MLIIQIEGLEKGRVFLDTDENQRLYNDMGDWGVMQDTLREYFESYWEDYLSECEDNEVEPSKTEEEVIIDLARERGLKTTDLDAPIWTWTCGNGDYYLFDTLEDALDRSIENYNESQWVKKVELFKTLKDYKDYLRG